ncbi:MAG: DUF302 domain-containing protein [Candidatus Eisenbacteria bacterium]|uniref:DUF302 domain-containing protein n=1 Tax=Eiseniibacteriota bacterium TaxID=2212470 RepID=A0A956NET7_UNCEI|nr:DUF302 domain-containing protein [Candidatus Eisenbacteria bacterium]
MRTLRTLSLLGLAAGALVLAEHATNTPSRAVEPSSAGAVATNSGADEDHSVHVLRATVDGTEEEVLAKLRRAVEESGLRVMSELHQSKALATAGATVQSETFFVGNPELGKHLFAIEPGAGVVLPMRMNVYVDAAGHTTIAYIPPSLELAAFGNADLDRAAQKLDAKLAGIVESAQH